MKQVHFRTFHSSCATVFHCHSSVFLIKIRNWCVPMSHGTPKFLYLGKACRTSIFFIQVKGWGLTWKFKWGEVKLDAALGDVHTSKPYRNLKKINKKWRLSQGTTVSPSVGPPDDNAWRYNEAWTAPWSDNFAFPPSLDKFSTLVLMQLWRRNSVEICV